MILALRQFECGLVASRSPVHEGGLLVSLLTSPAFHSNDHDGAQVQGLLTSPAFHSNDNDGAHVQGLPYPTARGIFS